MKPFARVSRSSCNENKNAGMPAHDGGDMGTAKEAQPTDQGIDVDSSPAPENIWPPGVDADKARLLLEHGTTREIRKFLESIPGTPENMALAKRQRRQALHRQMQRKRVARGRKKNRVARQARAKNRGRK